MNLQISEVQAEIAQAAREFLGRRAVAHRERSLELAGPAATHEPDQTTWTHCAQLGWLSVTLPEQQGGLGLGLAEEVMLFREIGRFLAPGPFLSSALAARGAIAAGDLDLAEAIATGERRVGMVLDGTGIDVVDGGLGVRIRPGGLDVVTVRIVRGRVATDPGTRLAHVETPAVVLHAEEPDVLSRARVLLAAECIGIVEAVRDASADYARTRMQFGKPIGAFQSVKHRCAEMVIAVESVIGQVYQAALYVEDGHPDAAFHAATAYLLAARRASQCAADNVLNHGAIGFTWEHDAHRYVKRAHLLENQLGPLRGCYADILGPARHEFR